MFRLDTRLPPWVPFLCKSIVSSSLGRLKAKQAALAGVSPFPRVGPASAASGPQCLLSSRSAAPHPSLNPRGQRDVCSVKKGLVGVLPHRPGLLTSECNEKGTAPPSQATPISFLSTADPSASTFPYYQLISLINIDKRTKRKPSFSLSGSCPIFSWFSSQTFGRR